MSCLASIAAALRSCMPCPAQPPSRHWMLADRVSESRAVPGQTINVKLNSIPTRDTRGRIGHVRGIYITANGQFTMAGSLNDAVTAHQLRSLFQAVMLEDITGHAYWPSLDGRDVLDDVYFRHWAQIQTPYLQSGSQDDAIGNLNVQSGLSPWVERDYGIPADVGIGTINRQIGFYAPLVTLGAGMNPLAGLIPVAALQRASGQGSLRFKLQTEIAGAPSGVQFDLVENGEGETGLDVWVDMVYLPALVSEGARTLESYILPDQQGILHNPEDTTEYVVIRYREEDQPGANFTGFEAVNNLNIFTLKVAGWSEIDGYSIQDFVRRGLLFAASERDSAQTRMNAGQDLPLMSQQAAGLANAGILLPYRQSTMGAAAGELNFKYGSFGGVTSVRYLHRTIACNEEQRADELAQAAGCDPCSNTVMCDGKGQPTAQRVMKNGTMLILDPQAAGA